eukprot:753915-Hanusia_phi.AAC.26
MSGEVEFDGQDACRCKRGFLAQGSAENLECVKGTDEICMCVWRRGSQRELGEGWGRRGESEEEEEVGCREKRTRLSWKKRGGGAQAVTDRAAGGGLEQGACLTEREIACVDLVSWRRKEDA